MEDEGVLSVFATLLIDRNIEEAKRLLALHPDPKGAHRHGVLTHVCEFGPDDPDLLHHFIKLGATLELDSVGIRGGPIHSATATNKPKILHTLLELGTPVNLGSYRYTPLDNAFGFKFGEEANANGYTVGAIYKESRLCAKILLDAGAQPSECKRNVPQWIYDYVSTREKTRASAIAVLGLLLCRSSVISGGKYIGRDVLCVVARCVWSLRGN